MASMTQVNLHNQKEDEKSEKPFNEKTTREAAAEDTQKNDITIVLLGKTGSGKSETVNTITGKTTTDTASPTVNCQLFEEVAFGYNLKIVDTPGFSSPKVSNEKVFQDITAVLKEHSSTSGNTPVLLVVVKPGEFTHDDLFALSVMDEIVNQHEKYLSFVLFTHKDDLENDEVTIEKYLSEADELLKSIFSRLSHSYFIINNMADMPLREVQAKVLLDQLCVYVQRNWEPFYERYPKHVLSFLKGTFYSAYRYVTGRGEDV